MGALKIFVILLKYPNFNIKVRNVLFGVKIGRLNQSILILCAGTYFSIFFIVLEIYNSEFRRQSSKRSSSQRQSSYPPGGRPRGYSQSKRSPTI